MIGEQMTFSEPPKIATWILRIFGCHPDSEAILGDLCERYQTRPSSLWYWRQTFIEILISLMKTGAIFRITMWTAAGLLVSVCWGFYFSSADKATPVSSIVYSLAFLSQPVAGVITAFYPSVPLGLRLFVIANTVTYAVLGFIVQMIRQHYRHRHIANPRLERPFP